MTNRTTDRIAASAEGDGLGALAEPEDGANCACGAQFLNGSWWTRMKGLGHTHRVRRAPEPLNS